jgi:hypothetical protein
MALTQKMEMERPTTAFVAALERDPKAFPEHREHLLKAFASNPDFDLARSNIDAAVKAMNSTGSSNSSSENVTPATGASTADAPTTTKKRAGKNAQKRKLAETPDSKLKSLQRVFKITPTYRHSKVLMDNGISSSAQIHAFGEKRFVRKFAGANGIFSKAEASAAFHKAQDIHITSGVLAGQAHGNGNALKVAALGTKITAEDLQPIAPSSA